MSGLSFRNNVFSMGANGFSTANRYPRQVALAADTDVTMVQGKSFTFNVEFSGQSSVYLSWRFECGALTFFSNGGTTLPSAGFAVDRPLGL